MKAIKVLLMVINAVLFFGMIWFGALFIINSMAAGGAEIQVFEIFVDNPDLTQAVFFGSTAGFSLISLILKLFSMKK